MEEGTEFTDEGRTCPADTWDWGEAIGGCEEAGIAGIGGGDTVPTVTAADESEGILVGTGSADGAGAQETTAIVAGETNGLGVARF